MNSSDFKKPGILVCLSASPSSRHVIKAAAKMAEAMHAPFTALYVGDPSLAGQGGTLDENIRLAKELHASVHLISSNDIALSIAEYTRRSGVSDLFIGNSAPSGLFFSRGTLTSRIVRYLPDIDIHIIPDALATRPTNAPSGSRSIRWNMKDVLILIAVMTLATLLSFWFDQSRFSNANIITIYILAVLLTSILTSDRIYGLIASILYILLFNFLFIEPRFTLFVYDSEYLMTYFVTVVAALMTGSLAARMKNIVHQSVENAYQAKVLLDTSTSLQKAADETDIIDITCRQLVNLLNKDILFFPSRDRLSAMRPFGRNGDGDVSLPEKEAEAAVWVFDNDRRAGAFTEIFPDCFRQYLSIHTSKQIYGVIGIDMDHKPFNEYENTILLSILSECALTLENMKTVKERKEAEVLMQNERFRSGLLRSISHDLRTPLTSISGYAATLMENAEALSREERMNIYSDIEEDASWLRMEMENILAVTKLENSRYIHLSIESVEDVIAESLKHIDRRASGHHIETVLSDDYLMAEMDSGLITLVIINLVNNAVKYTPEGSHIIIRSWREDDHVLISVSDDGPGMAEEDRKHIFEPFYTGRKQITDSRRSLGLGLSLCAMIIEAHGQSITAQDNIPHGTVIRFTLKLKEVDYESV